MIMEKMMDFVPYVIGVLTTVAALKKDWISAKFFGKEKDLQLKTTQEQLEASQLANVREASEIYKEILDDVQKRFDDKVLQLEKDIDKLNGILSQLQNLVDEQEKIIKAYEKKYGKIEN